MEQPLLYIFARWPEPGKVKTRLIPDFGEEGAALIYTCLLTHTLAVARASGIAFELRVTGGSVKDFKDGLGEDLNIAQQGDGDLSDRLSRVPAPAIVIGSDCPSLSAEHLWAASDALATGDMVIGPAADGGYYLLGYNQDASFAFNDIPWSTDAVFAETLSRFTARGIDGVILPELSDVDTAADLKEWPEFMP